MQVIFARRRQVQRDPSSQERNFTRPQGYSTHPSYTKAAVSEASDDSESESESDTNSTTSEPARPKPRKYETGLKIRWRGYGAPKFTPVPVCTSRDRYHYFNGSGTNGTHTRYRCIHCGFCCSENKDKK